MIYAYLHHHNDHHLQYMNVNKSYSCMKNMFCHHIENKLSLPWFVDCHLSAFLFFSNLYFIMKSTIKGVQQRKRTTDKTRCNKGTSTHNKQDQINTWRAGPDATVQRHHQTDLNPRFIFCSLLFASTWTLGCWLRPTSCSSQEHLR